MSVLVYDGVSVVTGALTESEGKVATVMLMERKDGARGGLFSRALFRPSPPVPPKDTQRREPSPDTTCRGQCRDDACEADELVNGNHADPTKPGNDYTSAPH